MNKKNLYTIAITAVVVLVLADRLKALPVINKLPTV